MAMVWGHEGFDGRLKSTRSCFVAQRYNKARELVQSSTTKRHRVLI